MKSGTRTAWRGKPVPVAPRNSVPTELGLIFGNISLFLSLSISLTHSLTHSLFLSFFPSKESRSACKSARVKSRPCSPANAPCHVAISETRSLPKRFHLRLSDSSFARVSRRTLHVSCCQWTAASCSSNQSCFVNLFERSEKKQKKKKKKKKNRGVVPCTFDRSTASV